MMLLMMCGKGGQHTNTSHQVKPSRLANGLVRLPLWVRVRSVCLYLNTLILIHPLYRRVEHG